MSNFKRRSMLKMSAAAAATVSMPRYSNAQTVAYVQPATYTAADLGGVLTPFGGIKAGNADGSIPAWDGGGYPMPAGYVTGQPRPIPFADEAPKFVITKDNLAQYQDKVCAGLQGLFQKHPDFTASVFPTHRTAIAPQWVYDFTAKNAVNAQLTDSGNGITGAYGGLPFPIPTNGAEVMWNHLLSWAGTSLHFDADAFAITAAGQLITESDVHVWFQYPYYFEDGEAQFNGFFIQEFVAPYAPPYEAGADILELFPVNPVKEDIAAWEYLTGQRRVRRAPELQFDTPNSLAGGVTNWDESFIFEGKLIEYNFNYLGNRELFIPYNANKYSPAPITQQYLPHFLNPELTRWELHRCRVVEMTLKPGFRNVDARRVIYFDEDTGIAVMGEIYDANNALWKFMHCMPEILGDIPCVLGKSSTMTYDLQAGDYAAAVVFNSDTKAHWTPIARLPDSFFTPGRLAASSGGF